MDYEICQSGQRKPWQIYFISLIKLWTGHTVFLAVPYAEHLELGPCMPESEKVVPTITLGDTIHKEISQIPSKRIWGHLLGKARTDIKHAIETPP